MGGLLIKQALVNAHNNPKYKPIIDATRGLAFFATPHSGRDSTLVSLGGITTKIARTAGFQKGDEMLETLKSGSIFSDILQEHFRHQLDKYDIISFWGAQDSVVPADSARLGLPGDREHIVKLNADHRGLCKFGDSQTDQDNLDLVRSNVKEIYKAALMHQPPTSHIRTRTPQRLIPFPRNEDIVDRAIFAELEVLLPPSRDYQSAALWGLGGSGKTQIALQFAYRSCRDPTCSVFWVHADNETTFTQDYKSIAEKLGLTSTLEGEKLLKAVREGIETDTRWVLILDNADNLGLFGVGQQTKDKVSSLRDFIPRGPTGTVLWTSRDEQIAGSLVGARRAINVSSMAFDEAMALLERVGNKKVGNDEAEDAAALLTELDRLPLAISQAAAYIRRTRTTIKAYLSKLHRSKKRWKMLEEAEFDRHRRIQVSNSILKTWSISIEQIRQDNEMAYRILHVHAFVDNQNIPFEMIKSAARYDDEIGAATDDATSDTVSLGATISSTDSEADDDDVFAAITRLRDFSFLSKQASKDKSPAYEMHKLVQEATRYGLNKQGEPGEEGDFSNMALQIVSNLFQVRQRYLRGECEKYVAHALRVSEWAELCKRENEASELLTRVSNYLYDRGRWREKEAVDRRAYRFRKKTLGKRHPNTIQSMGSLAATYHALGRYE
ncbi:P-loop containing nucleoside triphosphate hydrolase protein, partial [Pseudomassariella vexata]